MGEDQNKVFANIPFAIEGKIVRKLLGNLIPPQDCYLVIRADLAKRLSGINRENQFSLLHKPWFKFSLIHNFNRQDFTPTPSVDCCLWRIYQRPHPIIPLHQRQAYQHFVAIGFNQGDTIKRNLCHHSSLINQAIWKKFNISNTTKPTDPTFDQWLILWHIYQKELAP